MAKSLNVAALDFDAIKQNLKTFLQDQSAFSDYDFDGSALSILLDVLAYNTHYNAFYANMAVNEMFLDSAVKRSSVVSLAKMLNYVPKSAIASKAKLNVTLQGVSPNITSVALSRYTNFSLDIDGQIINFFNTEPYTIYPVAGSYTIQGVEVHEGNYVTNTFIVNEGGPAEKYELPNLNIDLNTVRVTINPSTSSSDTFVYDRFSGDITQLGSFTKVYFIDENTRGYYEIYFGDGVLGGVLSPGNVVTVEYLVTSGSAGNVSKKISPSSLVFTVPGGINGFSATIVAQSAPIDGADPETIDDIRFNAPKYATLQNRLVTKADFAAFLKRNFNYIDEISTWGGEENDPPDYGKVFISILPTDGEYLTQTRKDDMLAAMQDKKMMSTRVEFTTPTVTYLSVSSTVKYNPNSTTKKNAEIEERVRNAIVAYFNSNLGTFERRFSYSKLLSDITNADNSILSSSLFVKAQRRITPRTGRSNSFKIKMPNNKLLQNSITSSAFYYFDGANNILARFQDYPKEATVSATGKFKRYGKIVTITFDKPHGLTVGERVVLKFSSGIPLNRYTIYEVPDSLTFTIISPTSGTLSGTVTVTSFVRGTLKLVSLANENKILNPNVGFVSYQEGLIQINNLTLAGYAKNQTFIQVYYEFTADSQDIESSKNSIVKLDDTANADSEINRDSAISISVTQVPL